MNDDPGRSRASLLDRLADPEPLIAVELRPPRAGLSSADSREAWIDANHALRRLAASRTVVFVTDNAVGAAEEENLQHLVANVGPAAQGGRIVPFLTCKHTLEHCLLYAERAWQSGYRALVVLGGDRHDSVPRCVSHGSELRRILRERTSGFALGGWANPHREATGQVGFLADENFHADFYLTQVVSHHELSPVERFVEEAGRRGLTLPGIFGVFYWRSASPATLRRLSQFLPVPVDALVKEFADGATPEDVCARTILALRKLGITRTYVSNLPTATAAQIVSRLRALVAETAG